MKSILIIIGAICINLTSFLASGLAANQAIVKTGTNANPSDNSWVVTSISELSIRAVKLDEIVKLRDNRLSVMTLTYFSSFNRLEKVSGSYSLTREEIDCASKTITKKGLQEFTLESRMFRLDTSVRQDPQSTFPQTVARFHVDKVCQLSLGQKDGSEVIFPTIENAIAVFKVNKPPLPDWGF